MMHLKRVRRLAVLAAIIGVGSIGLSPMAHAQASIDGCLAGDYPPDTLIAQYHSSPGFLLRCGTPISIGVLHIDDEHTITPGSEIDFLNCATRLFLEGAYRGPGNRPDLAVWDRELGRGRFAIGVYEIDTGNIVTIYTSGTISNNWSLCATA